MYPPCTPSSSNRTRKPEPALDCRCSGWRLTNSSLPLALCTPDAFSTDESRPDMDVWDDCRECAADDGSDRPSARSSTRSTSSSSANARCRMDRSGPLPSTGDRDGSTRTVLASTRDGRESMDTSDAE